MTRDSAMFVAGPPVVKRLGQDLSKQKLGGADNPLWLDVLEWGPHMGSLCSS